MRFYTQEDLCLEQVGVDVWRIGLTKTATRPNGVTSSWSYECYQFAQGWMNRHLGNNTQ